MERNPNDLNTNLGGTPAGGPGFGTTGAGTAGTTGAGSFGQEQGTRDKARDKANELKDQAQDKASEFKGRANEKLGQAREKAHEWKMSLAEKLEQGADRLRQRQADGGSGAYATSAGAISSSQSDARMGQAQDKLATGMQRSAEWLRENDLDSMKSGIERQVRENPGRSMVIALGLGYLIGKAFRR